MPFSVHLYGEFLTEALQDLEKEFGKLLNETQPELGKWVNGGERSREIRDGKEFLQDGRKGVREKRR